MSDQNNIQDELNGMNSNLPANNSPFPFSVPEGYFEGLAASVLAKAKAQTLSAADELRELSPLLAGISKTIPYYLPEGYLTESMQSLSSLVQEEKESPVLAAVGKSLPYTVPNGYFENLAQEVTRRIVKPKAKVIPLFARTWMRAAVAAVIGGIIFTGGYQYFNSGKETQTGRQPVDTSKNWVAKNDPAVVQDIKNLSTKELDEFIKTVPVSPFKKQKVAVQPAEKSEVKDLLKDVSEKEIDTFLEQLPTAGEDLASID